MLALSPHMRPGSTLGADGGAGLPPFSFCAGPHGQGRGHIGKENLPELSEQLVRKGDTQPPVL